MKSVYKLGFEKSSGSYFIYSGSKNRDTPFWGSKTACLAILAALQLDADISFKIMKEWIALNEWQMEGMNEEEIEEHINIIGYIGMTRLKRIRQAERTILHKELWKEFLKEKK